MNNKVKEKIKIMDGETKIEEKPLEVGAVKPTTQIVKLSDLSEVTISKLKAGSYYKAQKIYTQWLLDVQNIVKTNKSGINYAEFLKENGDVDNEKLQAKMKEAGLDAETQVDTAAILTKLTEAKNYGASLVAIQLNKDEEAVLNEYYPDDIDAMVAAILSVNNFYANLKNFVTPLVGQGEKA